MDPSSLRTSKASGVVEYFDYQDEIVCPQLMQNRPVLVYVEVTLHLYEH